MMAICKIGAQQRRPGQWLILLLLAAAAHLACLNGVTVAFQVVAPGRYSQQLHSGSTTTLGSVIRADEVDFDFDVGQGGVRLAQESAVKMTGNVSRGGDGGGKIEANIKDLLRYHQVTELSDVLSKLEATGSKVVATGRGEEKYHDVGSATEAKITFAPMAAVQAALVGVTPLADGHDVVVNVLGGDDLQVVEVLDALQALVPALNVDSKRKITFHSLSHASFAKQQATLTVVSVPTDKKMDAGDAADSDEPVPKRSGVDKAFAAGEVYFYNGSWFTVVEGDLNTAKM